MVVKTIWGSGAIELESGYRSEDSAKLIRSVSSTEATAPLELREVLPPLASRDVAFVEVSLEPIAGTGTWRFGQR